MYESYVPRSVLDMLDARRENWLSGNSYNNCCICEFKRILLINIIMKIIMIGTLKQTQTY